MAISAQLKACLDASKVSYTVMTHPTVYTAQEIAAAQHVPGRQLAKSVLVTTPRGPFLAVLPATHLIDFKKLKRIAGATTLRLATESEITERFPDVEVGAMSPFGQLYQVPVLVDRTLEESGELVFNAGSHTDTVKMRYRDFAALIKPTVGEFGQPINAPAKPRPRRPSRSRSRASTATRSARSRVRATRASRAGHRKPKSPRARPSRP